MDKYKNDKRDVTKMGLAQADKASVTKLSGMDSTDRKQKWQTLRYKNHHTNGYRPLRGKEIRKIHT